MKNRKIITSVLTLLLYFSSYAQVSQTAKSGRWSDPAIWVSKKVPAPSDKVIVNTKHTLTVDAVYQVAGIDVLKTATLTFTASKTCRLVSTQNIVIHGRLVMKSASAAIIHSITFAGIDESKFIGGGMEVMASDVGLWVTGSVDISGANKTAWTELSEPVAAGLNTIKVLKSTGWRVGDQITICPTAPISQKNHYQQFDTRIIRKISGNTISLDSAIRYNHPATFDPVNKKYYQAKILNLTRNVIIEGTDSGRTHVIFLMAGKQMVSNAHIRYVGPRRGPPGSSVDILGRYGLHDHHCGNASKGTLFQGIVVTDAGSHAFVPHASHGITLKNCIAFNTLEDAYWWDLPPDNSTSALNNSNGTTIDSCVAALTMADPNNKGYRLPGFLLGSGLDNTIRNCFATGNHGTNGAAGYIWPESSNYMDNRWTFENNTASNNRNNGIFTWQNDTSSHLIKGFTGYQNGNHGIEHGAYHNAYKYQDINLFSNGNGILLHATAIQTGKPDEYGYRSSFTNVKSTEPLFITVHTLPGTPTLFLNCSFPKVIISELPARVPNPPGGLYDFVNCRLLPENFEIIGIEEKSVLRVQDGQAFEITRKGHRNIDQFFKP